LFQLRVVTTVEGLLTRMSKQPDVAKLKATSWYRLEWLKGTTKILSRWNLWPGRNPGSGQR